MPKRKSGWKRLDSEVRYDNPWIRVIHDRVINPSGSPGIYGRVHFKNLAIGVIPLDEHGNTWLVGQYRYPLKRYSWEIPEGGGKLNIPPLVSAKRELREETGISARRWKKILEMDLSNSATDERAIVYLAQDLSFGNAHPDEDEVLKIRKVSFEQCYRWVCSGFIRDAITVAAVLRLKTMFPL